MAWVPVPAFVDGQVLTAALVTPLKTNLDWLNLTVRRANTPLAVVNQRWEKWGDVTIGYGSWARETYRMAARRLPYLLYGVIAEWDWHYPAPRCEILVNGVVVEDVGGLLPITPEHEIRTTWVEGRISIASLVEIGMPYQIIFRYSPPYPVDDPNPTWTGGAAGHVALHYLVEGDDDYVGASPPAGWVAPPLWEHRDWVTAADLNKLVDDMELIHALADTRVNPVAVQRREWQLVDQNPDYAANGLTMVHEKRWLFYECAADERYEDESPRVQPLFAGEDDEVTLPREPAGTVQRYDLDGVAWLTVGVVYRVLGAGWAWEDDA